MKKLVCTLLALAMLCSFTVVNVSAANTYEGKGFELVMDYDANFERDSYDYGGNGAFYNCEIESLESEIEILEGDVEWMMASMGVEPNDEINTCKDLYEYAAIALGTTGDTESIVINGAPATVCFSRDLTFCIIIQYSDNYFYYMEFGADNTEKLNTIYDIIVDGFVITDSVSDFTVDAVIEDEDDATKMDEAGKDEKADDKEDKAENDNTLIVIVAIVTVGVVVIAVVAIVVLGKKKKA
jgi:hypothetical protein